MQHVNKQLLIINNINSRRENPGEQQRAAVQCSRFLSFLLLLFLEADAAYFNTIFPNYALTLGTGVCEISAVCRPHCLWSLQIHTQIEVEQPEQKSML